MPEPSARFQLRVSPGSGASAIVGRHGDGWKRRVTAPPEGGRANDAVLRLLADVLALPRSSVSLVSGHGGREKIVELAGLDRAETERRLELASTKGGR